MDITGIYQILILPDSMFSPFLGSRNGLPASQGAYPSRLPMDYPSVRGQIISAPLDTEVILQGVGTQLASSRVHR